VAISDFVQSVTNIARRHVEPGNAPAFLDDPNAELQFCSLEMVAFIADLEKIFCIQFPADMIDGRTFRTVRTVADSLQAISEGKK